MQFVSSLDALLALDPRQRSTRVGADASTYDCIVLDLVVGDLPGRRERGDERGEADTQPDDEGSSGGEASVGHGPNISE